MVVDKDLLHVFKLTLDLPLSDSQKIILLNDLIKRIEEREKG